MRVTVVGGGNIGTLLAAEIASRGHEVRMLVSDAIAWSDVIQVYNTNDEVVCVGELTLVTTDPKSAIEGSEWVFVTHPSSRFSVVARWLVPMVEQGQRVCVVPGADAEFYFSGLLGRGAELLGLQRVHCIARLKERGKSVYQLGHKSSVQLASIPVAAASARSSELSVLLNMPVDVLSNYLTETLTPSNPILHTTRLATMFANWQEGISYPRNYLFYEEWDDAASELMIACDEELQELCRRIEVECGVDLSGVRPLTEHYESPGVQAMTEKISHIPAFKGLVSPMRETARGTWVPDFSSRYFKADFETGLKAIVDMADVFGIETPKMKSVMSWYEMVSGAKPARFVPSDKKWLMRLCSA